MAGSQTALREANRATVVDTIRRYGGLTQVELASTTGLSAATVSNIVRELEAAVEVDVRATIHHGRRATLVAMVHRMGLAAGVHVGTRHMSITLTDSAHQVLVERALPLPHERHADTSLDRAVLLIVDDPGARRLRSRRAPRHRHRPPRPVDAANGTVSVPGILPGWDDAPVAQVMFKRLGIPVFVDKDANLGALAEGRLGASRHFQDSVNVRASRGTGAGISLHKNLHRGFAGTAGEIGLSGSTPRARSACAGAAAASTPWSAPRPSSRCSASAAPHSRSR